MADWDEKIERLRRVNELASFAQLSTPAHPVMSAGEYDVAMERIAVMRLELADMRTRLDVLERRAENG